jgi:phosphatidate cytidylyltransferase
VESAQDPNRIGEGTDSHAGGGLADDVTKFGPQVPIKGGRSLAQAVLTAAILVVLVIVCYIGGAGWFFWLAAAALLLALYELLDAIERSGRQVEIPFALACGMGLLAAAYFQPDRPELLAVVGAVTVFGSFVLALRPNRGPTPASDVAWTVLAVVWVAGAGAAATSMLALAGGVNLLVAHVAITASDDISAYFVGVRWGRRKLAPSISPAKSWEGFIGGVAVALVAGTLFGALLDELTVGDGLAIAAIIGVLAPAGDLAESMAKRELGIKDSGRLLPGHGGFLDRLDAMIFCAPAVLLYLRLAVV